MSCSLTADAKFRLKMHTGHVMINCQWGIRRHMKAQAKNMILEGILDSESLAFTTSNVSSRGAETWGRRRTARVMRLYLHQRSVDRRGHRQGSFGGFRHSACQSGGRRQAHNLPPSTTTLGLTRQRKACAIRACMQERAVIVPMDVQLLFRARFSADECLRSRHYSKAQLLERDIHARLQHPLNWVHIACRPT